MFDELGADGQIDQLDRDFGGDFAGREEILEARDRLGETVGGFLRFGFLKGALE